MWEGKMGKAHSIICVSDEANEIEVHDVETHETAPQHCYKTLCLPLHKCVGSTHYEMLCWFKYP